jgi:hypothetical protein
MRERLPTVALAFGVAALAAGDWLVSGSTAEDPEAREPAAPAPTQVEVDRALSGPGATAVVDGCPVRLERVGARGYRLQLQNPGATAVALAVEVETWETRGSALSRRLPRPERRTSETVRVTLAVGASASRTLAYQDPAPPDVGQPVAVLGEGGGAEFRRVEFVVRRPVAAAAGETPAPGPELARLRLPEPGEAAEAGTPAASATPAAPGVPGAPVGERAAG